MSPTSDQGFEVARMGGRHVFLSAGIPGEKYSGPTDPAEIGAAVTAAVRAILRADGRLLFGGQPAIAPLVLRLAENFGGPQAEPRITVYQSQLYANTMEHATRQLAARRLARLEIVDGAAGEQPVRGRNAESLTQMRLAMLGKDNDPVAGIFIGGMDGIRQEFKLFRELYPERPTYIFGVPGGEAGRLAAEELRGNPAASSLARRLAAASEYDVLMDGVVRDIARVAGG